MSDQEDRDTEQRSPWLLGILGALVLAAGVDALLSGTAGGTPGTRSVMIRGWEAHLTGLGLVLVGGFSLYWAFRSRR